MDGTMEIIQSAFHIEQKDNVATAQEQLIPGAQRLLGDRCRTEAEAVQKIPKGHNIARHNISAGEDVIKYGVRIARASKDIRAGEWVHLHNIRSVYDERSSHLDAMTGAPKDTRYE